MQTLLWAFDRLVFGMHRLAGVFLVLMVVVTVVDVITRGLFAATGGAFSWTVTGSVELAGFGLLFTMLFTFPYAVGHAQVIVDVFSNNWSKRAQDLASSFYLIGFVLLGAGMCYGFYDSAFRVAATGQTSQDLELPLWIFYGISSFASGVLCLRSLEISIRRALNKEREDTKPSDDVEEGAL